MIYGWCRQGGLQADDAEDVVQEVLQAVNSHVGKFRREQPGDTFRGWVWTVTKNKIRDFYRRQDDRAKAAGGTAAWQQLQQTPSTLPEEMDASVIAESNTTLTHGALELVKAEFEQSSWDAFWRCAVEGHKPALVAAEMGLSVAAVYKAKSRVLRRVREELAGMLD